MKLRRSVLAAVATMVLGAAAMTGCNKLPTMDPGDDPTAEPGQPGAQAPSDGPMNGGDGPRRARRHRGGHHRRPMFGGGGGWGDQGSDGPGTQPRRRWRDRGSDDPQAPRGWHDRGSDAPDGPDAP